MIKGTIWKKNHRNPKFFHIFANPFSSTQVYKSDVKCILEIILVIDIKELKEILIIEIKYQDAAYLLPFLNKAENPLFGTTPSEKNFTNS